MPNASNTPDSAVRYATSEEVAQRVKLHPGTVRRIFSEEPGVLRSGIRAIGIAGDISRSGSRRMS